MCSSSRCGARSGAELVAWLIVALSTTAWAAETCSPVVKVERRNPLDPGNGYAWPDIYAGTWLQPTKRFVRFEPRKIGNIEGAVHAHVVVGVLCGIKTILRADRRFL